MEEVSVFLVNKGHKATPSSIYNWENNISQPKPSVLFDMCRTYGIKDVLRTFGYINEDEMPFTLTTEEQSLLEKYRALDSYGMQAVDAVINVEYARYNDHDKIRRIRYYQNSISAGSG